MTKVESERLAETLSSEAMSALVRQELEDSLRRIEAGIEPGVRVAELLTFCADATLAAILRDCEDTFAAVERGFFGGVRAPLAEAEEAGRLVAAEQWVRRMRDERASRIAADDAERAKRSRR